jgi:hypothetical protein
MTSGGAAEPIATAYVASSGTKLSGHPTWSIAMHDPERGGPTNSVTLAAIVAAFVLVFVIIVSGPWNNRHVASNPGPSGTPGSTAVEGTPPPADGPSGGTTTTGRVR